MPYWGARCGGGLGHAGSRLARPARLVRMARVALLARVARLGRLARLERQARLARLARPARLIRQTRLAPGPATAPPVPGTAAAGVAAPPKRPGVRPLEVTTRGRSPRRGRHRLVRRWLVRRRRGGARKNCRSIASLQDSRQPSARGAHHGAALLVERGRARRVALRRKCTQNLDHSRRGETICLPDRRHKAPPGRAEPTTVLILLLAHRRRGRAAPRHNRGPAHHLAAGVGDAHVPRKRAPRSPRAPRAIQPITIVGRLSPHAVAAELMQVGLTRGPGAPATGAHPLAPRCSPLTQELVPESVVPPLAPPTRGTGQRPDRRRRGRRSVGRAPSTPARPRR